MEEDNLDYESEEYDSDQNHEVKIRINFLEAVKFGIGFAAGVFIWGIIVFLLAALGFGGMFWGMMNTFRIGG